MDEPIFQYTHLHPGVKQWGKFDVILEKKTVSIVVPWKPRLNNSGQQSGMDNAMVDEHASMGPGVVPRKVQRLKVAVLLYVNTKINGIAIKPRGR